MLCYCTSLRSRHALGCSARTPSFRLGFAKATSERANAARSYPFRFALAKPMPLRCASRVRGFWLLCTDSLLSPWLCQSDERESQRCSFLPLSLRVGEANAPTVRFARKGFLAALHGLPPFALALPKRRAREPTRK